MLISAACLAAPSAAHAVRCDRQGGEVVWQTQRVSVLVNRNFEDRDIWTGCWRASGRLTRLGVVTLDEKGRARSVLDGFKASGAWLAWGRYSARPGYHASMQSRNLQAGTRGPAVKAPAKPMLGQTDGPIANLDPPTYVLASNGNFGWLAAGQTAEGADAEGIYVPDRAGGSRLLDRGPTGAISHLRVQALVMTWFNGATKHSFSLQ